MVRSRTDTKTKILSAAYGLFYKQGFSRVSVDAIAEATGFTKRTLYHHFESKDALVAAMLDHQHAHALARIQGWSDKEARTPAEFLAALFESLERWASRPRWLGSGFTRLTMELADLPGHPARRAALQHKSAVESWMAEELARLGAENARDLARHVMLLIEGCLSLTLIHGDISYVGAAGRAALRLAERDTA